MEERFEEEEKTSLRMSRPSTFSFRCRIHRGCSSVDTAAKQLEVVLKRGPSLNKVKAGQVVEIGMKQDESDQEGSGSDDGSQDERSDDEEDEQEEADDDEDEEESD